MLEKEEAERLREKLARVQELSATCLQAAHRLNSSLTVMQGYAQLLLEKDLNEETQGLLKKIDQEAQKATKTIAEFAKAAKEISE